MNFADFNFHPNTLKGIRAFGYSVPTPVQARAIPMIMQGKDVIAIARPGEGRMAAFALPILHLLRTGRRGSLRALVISPTRELAEQTRDLFNRLGAGTGLQSAAIYSGVP